MGSFARWRREALGWFQSRGRSGGGAGMGDRKGGEKKKKKKKREVEM